MIVLGTAHVKYLIHHCHSVLFRFMCDDSTSRLYKGNLMIRTFESIWRIYYRQTIFPTAEREREREREREKRERETIDYQFR